MQDVDAERALWAKEFVNQCVAKALQAVALTDHHEMIMVPYVQNELEERREIDPEFDLWLFPGMELTARGGRQCLIIFDVDLSEDWRKQAQGKLGIVHAERNEKNATAPNVTQIKLNYPDIAKALDDVEGLRGKYIILPNVSQGNSHTVLTDGAHEDFHRMPYIGGYLDKGQTLETLRPKNRKRLSGSDKFWSNREIYPLPTSDSRSSDYATLGENNTWIKLAEPTAEGIRQAFLGHRSRIQIEPPKIPSLVISSVNIDNSTILNSTNLSLSPELNAVIGGRGSGKSSFLEYIAFGLGRSCFDASRKDYSGTDRMHDLIQETIISNGGKVSLYVTQDDASFLITRSQATAYQPQITYPSGRTQTVVSKELRTLFPAVVYSQGELAEIGKDAGRKAQLSDLLRFVNPNYKLEDDRLTSNIEFEKSNVKSAIQIAIKNWKRQSELRRLTTTRDSLKQRAEALEKNLPTLSPNDQAIVSYFDQANDFESKRIQASKHADQILQELEASATELLSERDLSTNLKDDVVDVCKSYHELFKAFKSGLEQLQADLTAKRSKLSIAESGWVIRFEKARNARDDVLKKLGAHKTVTSQIILLREQITELNNQIGDLETKLKTHGDPSKGLTEAVTKLWHINDERGKRTQEWAREIERLSNRKIKAVVAVTGNNLEIKEALDTIAAKTGSQESTRIKELEEALARDTSVNVVNRLLTECLALLCWRELGAASGEAQPECADLLKILGDTERIRKFLFEHLDASRVEAIATAITIPEIALSYSDGTREISFEKASEGQRAAALLFMLLEQPGGPLIIDQPEGDLDNKIIVDLTYRLHDAKQNRQLIFASHNANIVVNGASELVGCLDVTVSGERMFECNGAIDKPLICDVITSTMEGGEKAFKDRQDKYGY